MVAVMVSDRGLLFAGAVFSGSSFWNQVCAKSPWGKQPLGESVQGESAWKAAELTSSTATSFGVRWLLLDRLVGTLGPFARSRPNDENAGFLIGAFRFTYN